MSPPRGYIPLKIKTIINFRSLHDFREEAEAQGFKYYAMPMPPLFAPTYDQIDEFLAMVNDPANQPVYIHCKLGVDRTGVMAGIYRIERDNWTNQRAVEEMEHFGHNEIWHELEEFLEDYRPKRRNAPTDR